MMLVAVAGATDAIGFLKLSHLFVSFMSGNSTQLAIAAIRADRSGAFRAGMLVLTFVLGAMAGRAVFRIFGNRYRAIVLLCDAALLATAAAIARGPFMTILPLPFAMGMQNAAVRNAGTTKTSLTYVTGTLVHFGETLVDTLFGERTAWIAYGAMWLALIAGAIVGTVFFQVIGLDALFVPALLCLILGVYSTR